MPSKAPTTFFRLLCTAEQHLRVVPVEQVDVAVAADCCAESVSVAFVSSESESESELVVSDVVVVVTVVVNWSTLVPSTERISEAALSSIVAIDGRVGVAIAGMVTDVASGTVIVNELDGRAMTIIDADVVDAAAAFVACADEDDADFEVDVVSVFDVVFEVVDDDEDAVVAEDFISTGFLVPSGSGIPGGG